MNIIKKVTLFIGIYILITIISPLNVKAVVESDGGVTRYYSEVYCTYENSSKQSITITRKQYGDRVQNYYDGEYITSSTRSGYDVYNNSTDCPSTVSVDSSTNMEDFGQINKVIIGGSAYSLKDKKSNGIDITNKVTKCEYTLKNPDYDGSIYRLSYEPKLKINTATNVLALKYELSVEKQNSDGSWQTQNDPKLFGNNEFKSDGDGNVIVCPDYAHYNPPIPLWPDQHEYILNNTTKNPWSFDSAHIVLDLTSNLSEQEKQMNSIYEEFKKNNDSLIEQLESSCIFSTETDVPQSGLTLAEKCGLYTPTKTCNKQTIETYSNLLIENYNSTIAQLNNVEIEGTKIANLEEGAYVDLQLKYNKIVTSITNDLKDAQESIKCMAYMLYYNDVITKDELNNLVASLDSVLNNINNLKFKEVLDLEQYDCTILGSEILDWLDKAFKFVQIGAVVLVIILGMLDFGKATVSSENDALKKVGQKFIKRIIAVIILLILPVLIEFILDLANIPGMTNNDPLCR